MIKVDIVNEVSRLAEITKVKAEVAVDAVFDAMRASMMRGERIELRGFGVFQVKPRKRGIGRNPRTGKEVRIPPGRTIRFKPGKELQNIGGQLSDPLNPDLLNRVPLSERRESAGRCRTSSLVAAAAAEVPASLPAAHRAVLADVRHDRRSRAIGLRRLADQRRPIARSSAARRPYSRRRPVVLDSGADDSRRARVRPLLLSAACTTSTRRCPSSCRRRICCSRARSAPSSASARRFRRSARCSTSASPARSPDFVALVPFLYWGITLSQLVPIHARRGHHLFRRAAALQGAGVAALRHASGRLRRHRCIRWRSPPGGACWRRRSICCRSASSTAATSSYAVLGRRAALRLARDARRRPRC